MPRPAQHLQIQTAGDSGKNHIKGHATRAVGKKANVTLQGALKSDAGKLTVYTIGRDDPTNAEELRAHAVRMALQRRTALTKQPFVRAIWFPGQASTEVVKAARTVKMIKAEKSTTVEVTFEERPLNASQRKAVEAILDESPERGLVVIHGGPGTGEPAFSVSTNLIKLMSRHVQGKPRSSRHPSRVSWRIETSHALSGSLHSRTSRSRTLRRS